MIHDAINNTRYRVRATHGEEKEEEEDAAQTGQISPVYFAHSNIHIIPSSFVSVNFPPLGRFSCTKQNRLNQFKSKKNLFPVFRDISFWKIYLMRFMNGSEKVR